MAVTPDNRTAYVHLPQDTIKGKPLDQYYPEQTQRVQENLGTLSDQPLVADGRAASGDLLVGNRADNSQFTHAILADHLTALQGRHIDDLGIQLYTIRSGRNRIRGSKALVLHMAEGRDDRQRNFSVDREGKQADRTTEYAINVNRPPLLNHYVNKVKGQLGSEKLAGVAIWEPHSSATIREFRRVVRRGDEFPPVFPFTAARIMGREMRRVTSGLDQQAVNLGLAELNGHRNGNPRRQITSVVGMDMGSYWRNKVLADELGVPAYFLNKKRTGVNIAETSELLYTIIDGEIVELDPNILEGQEIATFDDMIDTGGTLVGALGKLHASGVHVAITHSILNDPASERIERALENGLITDFYTTDSLPTHARVLRNGASKFGDRIHVISTAPYTAAAMRVFAGEFNPNDRSMVESCIFHPGPKKEDLERAFKDRHLDQSTYKDPLEFAGQALEAAQTIFHYTRDGRYGGTLPTNATIVG